jgi:hypothetical protein
LRNPCWCGAAPAIDASRALPNRTSTGKSVGRFRRNLSPPIGTRGCAPKTNFASLTFRFSEIHDLSSCVPHPIRGTFRDRHDALVREFGRSGRASRRRHLYCAVSVRSDTRSFCDHNPDGPPIDEADHFYRTDAYGFWVILPGMKQRIEIWSSSRIGHTIVRPADFGSVITASSGTSIQLFSRRTR